MKFLLCSPGTTIAEQAPRWVRMESDLMNQQPNNPLHGVTLEAILLRLVDHYGWDELGSLIRSALFSS